LSQLKAHKSELIKQLNIPKDIERKLHSERNKNQELQQRLSVDAGELKKGLLKQYEDTVNQLLSKVSDMLKSNKIVIDLKIEKAVASTMKASTQAEVQQATEALADAKDSLKTLQQAVKTAQTERAEIEKQKVKIEAELDEMVEQYGGEEAFEKLFTDKVDKICVENNLRDLQSRCLVLELELDSIVDNPEVVRRYNELQTQLVVLTAEVGK
jgi:hypothetical protein